MPWMLFPTTPVPTSAPFGTSMRSLSPSIPAVSPTPYTATLPGDGSRVAVWPAETRFCP